MGVWITGKSRTHGVPSGARAGTSAWSAASPKMVSVGSRTWRRIQSSAAPASWFDLEALYLQALPASTCSAGRSGHLDIELLFFLAFVPTILTFEIRRSLFDGLRFFFWPQARKMSWRMLTRFGCIVVLTALSSSASHTTGLRGQAELASPTCSS